MQRVILILMLIMSMVSADKTAEALIESLTKSVYRHYDYVKESYGYLVTVGSPTETLNDPMFMIVNEDSYRNGDVAVILVDGKLYQGVIHHSDLRVYINGSLRVLPLDTLQVLGYRRLEAPVSFELFMSFTAEVETNNRAVTNRLYHGRYQLAKRYIPGQMRKLGKEVLNWRISESEQREVFRLIYNETKSFLRRHFIPVNPYTMRMVYMLGRTNVLKWKKGRLPQSLKDSNLPKKEKDLREYWSKRTKEVYYALSD